MSATYLDKNNKQTLLFYITLNNIIIQQQIYSKFLAIKSDCSRHLKIIPSIPII